MRQCVVRVIVGMNCTGLFGAVAAGQPLVDNLAEPTRAATILGTEDPDRIWAAQSFAAPMYFDLLSIEVPLGNAAGVPDAVAELRRGDSAAGDLLALLALPPLAPTGFEVVTLLPDVSVTLEPETTYWIVLGTVSTGSFEWAYAEGNNFKGPGTIGNYMYSYDQGATWSDYGADNPYHIRVSGTPVDVCRADFNGDGVVNSQDFFDFLSVFFASDIAADFNGDLLINSQDFFDFLTAFFAGC